MKGNTFFLFVLLLYLIVSPEVFAKDSAAIVAKANAFMRAGNYDKALAQYNEALLADSNSAIINFNAGTAWFKKGDYEKAIGLFEKALLSDDKRLQAKAHYNIGNAKYKLGKRKVYTDLQSTVQLLRQALDYYKKAIELNNKDEKAKLNHEIVEKELKTLLDKLKREDKKHGQGRKQEGQTSAEQKPGGKEEVALESPKQEQEKNEFPEAQGQKKEDGVSEEKKDTAKQEAAEVKEGEDKPALKQHAAASDSRESAQEAQEMSADEARMLLEGFRQEENGQRHLQFTRQGRLKDPDKDW